MLGFRPREEPHGQAELVFSAGPHQRTLNVHRSARAKRMRLAVDPRDGTVRLTLPRRAALAPGLAWVESQRAWVEQTLAKLPVAPDLCPGATIPFEGATLTIDWREGKDRRVVREDDRIVLGGPAEMVATRVLRWLRAEAARTLDAETRAIAQRAEVTVGKVRIGDPRSRWGSCSSTGDIAYSWRLIMMPPAVREATVAHEVAHRRHMHHGPDFHAEVERLLGRKPVAERAWLKAHGAEMQRVGR